MDMTTNPTIIIRRFMCFEDTGPETGYERYPEEFDEVTPAEALRVADRWNYNEGEFSNCDVDVEFFDIETGAELAPEFSDSFGIQKAFGFEYAQGDEHDAAERQADCDAADNSLFY